VSRIETHFKPLHSHWLIRCAVLLQVHAFLFAELLFTCIGYSLHASKVDQVDPAVPFAALQHYIFRLNVPAGGGSM
jgi:hypothetical protein